MSIQRITIGTRGSPLALWQAEHVKSLLEKHHPGLEVSLKIIKTTGDVMAQVDLSEIGGKGVFLKEIEDQILKGEVHLGVHSMKDVPTVLPKGLIIGAILEREDPRDVFISHKYGAFSKLPKNARIGTGSLRRRSQIQNVHPHFEIVPLRGNVDTRLKKLETENLDAIILAAAGMRRLGFHEKITESMETSLMLPAVGQGAVGVELLDSSEDVKKLIAGLNHETTARCVIAERAFLRTLEGDCQAPIASYGTIEGQILNLAGMVASPDGRDLIRDRISGSADDAIDIGQRLAERMLAAGAREILKACKST